MGTREQADIPREFGGALMQGYDFGRDMPADAAPDFLARAAATRTATG